MDKNKEGQWQDADTFENCPEMQDLYDDIVIEHLKNENPELLELFKRHGFNADKATTKED